MSDTLNAVGSALPTLTEQLAWVGGIGLALGLGAYATTKAMRLMRGFVDVSERIITDETRDEQKARHLANRAAPQRYSEEEELMPLPVEQRITAALDAERASRGKLEVHYDRHNLPHVPQDSQVWGVHWIGSDR